MLNADNLCNTNYFSKNMNNLSFFWSDIFSICKDTFLVDHHQLHALILKLRCFSYTHFNVQCLGTTILIDKEVC